MGCNMTYHIPPVPHANFLDTTTQTITGATTAAYTVTLNTPVDASSGITLVSNSQITISEPGDYIFIISATGHVATSGNNKHINMWFAKGGVNIANSNTIIEIPNPNVEMVIAIHFIIDLLANEYIEIKWSSDTTNGQLLATGTQTNPTRPVSPSIIVNVNKMSE